MTTIERSAGILSNPANLAPVIPRSLGVDGIIARWYAPAIPQDIETDVTLWKDSVGTHDMVQSGSGVAVLKSTLKKRFVYLGRSASTDLVTSTTLDSPEVVTLAGAFFWQNRPSVSTRIFGLQYSATGTLSFATSGAVSLWAGGASPVLAESPIGPANGWHTIIGAFNGANSKLYIDGGLVASGNTGAASFNGNPFFRGNSTTLLAVADSVIIDHAVTTTEVAKLHANLAPAMPV